MNLNNLELWIARDKNNELYLYLLEPKRGEGKFVVSTQSIVGQFIEIDQKLFPDITFENSPQKVKMVHTK